ncbi:hypothetical protein Ga0466249_003980 [Sporomusaceae bacterium BoRhaA]|uniref:ABC transporter permease n=1 Tax=Pelorhabdus rhamnosifermentans TaxID=2772457 RepID=UPI001C06406A|nr:ABC transporter permease [Pelorhabdus rhamnosifermentans]MBU2702845.1 hypothetical protein [Pelorhabdus rhamnosifermentans]
MHSIMAIALQEMRLGLKSVGYWLLVMLTDSLAIFVIYENQYLGLWLLYVFYMFFVFWNTGMIARDWRRGISEIVNTLPCKDWELLMGRALGSFLLLVLLGMQLFLGIMTVVFFVFHMQLPFFNLLGDYWLNYILISINSICVALFIETICRSRVFLSIFITTIYLILMFFLEGDNFTSLPYWLPPINLAVNQAFCVPSSQLTGHFPNTGLIPVVVCYQLGFSAILLLVSFYFYSKRRSLGQLRLSYMLVLTTAFAVFLSGAILFVREYEGRDKTYQEAFVNAVADAGQAVDTANMLRPVRYVMDIKLKTALNTVDCGAKLFFRNTSNSEIQEIPLTLKNYYVIHNVKDGSGRELVWQRKGDFIEVKLSSPLAAGAAMEIFLDYSGKVWEWFSDYDTQPQGLINFVSPSMTLLRSGHAWYPTLGKNQVYHTSDQRISWSDQPRTVLSARYISHQSTAFTINVEIDKDMEVVTGLPLTEDVRLPDNAVRKFVFSSPSARDVFLIAAPYEIIKMAALDGNITAYCAKPHEDSAKNIVELVKDRITFYENLIPLKDKQLLNVVEVPGFLLDGWLGAAERKIFGLANSIPISEDDFISLPTENRSQGEVQLLYFEESVLSLWWPGFDTSDPGNISAGMLSYMYTLYKENKMGKEYYDGVKRFWLQYKPVPSVNRERRYAGGENLVVKEIFLLLDDIRQSELGDEGVKAFMQKVHTVSVNTYDREIEWCDILHVMDEFGQELLEKGYSIQQVNAIMAEPRKKAEYMNSLNLSYEENKVLLRIRKVH